MRTKIWGRALWGCAVLATVLSGCSKSEILTADTPDVITPENLDSPEGRSALFAGAVSDMVVAATGGIGFVLYTGLFTDELKHSSTPPAVREWDLRLVLTTNSVAVAATGPFLRIHRARAALEYIAGLLPTTDSRTGEALGLAAMSYIFLGENWCSGLPVSNRETGEFGPPLTTAELFSRAVDRADAAATATGGDSRVANLAAVLKGRALVNLGQFSEAAAAVANVPTSYEYEFIHGNPPARQTNQVWLQIQSDIYSVSESEGTNGLNFATAGDPRVPVSPPSLSRNDGVSQHYYHLKYTGQDSPITMVSGIEARLIQAEAALQGADINGWLNMLNTARATMPGLAPLADPGGATAREDLMFRERAFWLYLTGHRLGDLRRLVRQYGRAEESVYPTGAYHKQGLVRGTQGSWVVPQPEENNPNFNPSGCDAEAA